jgi:outer membrane protein, multidrug efflux system
MMLPPALRVYVALSAWIMVSVGCRTVGPDYHGPPRTAVVNAPTAQGKFVGSLDPAFSTDAVPSQWWHLYESAQLDELVNAALAANTDLRAAQANLERSQALLRQAEAARQPTAAISLQPSYQQLSTASYLHPGTLAPLGLYYGGVSVSYELDLFGRLKRGVEAAAADDEAVRAAYDLTRITVAAETTRAYAEACNAGEELDAARRSLELQEQSREATRKLVEAGRASSLDLTRSSGQVAQRLYLAGKVDFLNVLDVQRTLASADDAVAASHARLAEDQVAIFLALGGGWE